MVVTTETKYSELQPLENALTAETVEQFKAAAQRHFGAYAELTIDAFWGAVQGHYDALGDIDNPSVLQVYWVKGFQDFVQEFTKVCERLVIHDPEDENVTTGCVELKPQERMLTFVREYFGLPSFYDAGQRTIGEYILARKDSYNKQKQQQNMLKKQLRNMKKK